jgi:hypothetical protein
MSASEALLHPWINHHHHLSPHLSAPGELLTAPHNQITAEALWRQQQHCIRQQDAAQMQQHMQQQQQQQQIMQQQVHLQTLAALQVQHQHHMQQLHEEIEAMQLEKQTLLLQLQQAQDPLFSPVSHVPWLFKVKPSPNMCYMPRESSPDDVPDIGVPDNVRDGAFQEHIEKSVMSKSDTVWVQPIRCSLPATTPYLTGRPVHQEREQHKRSSKSTTRSASVEPDATNTKVPSRTPDSTPSARFSGQRPCDIAWVHPIPWINPPSLGKENDSQVLDEVSVNDDAVAPEQLQVLTQGILTQGIMTQGINNPSEPSNVKKICPSPWSGSSGAEDICLADAPRTLHFKQRVWSLICCCLAPRHDFVP